MSLSANRYACGSSPRLMLMHHNPISRIHTHPILSVKANMHNQFAMSPGMAVKIFKKNYGTIAVCGALLSTARDKKKEPKKKKNRVRYLSNYVM